MTEREINALCDRVRQTAYEIHLYLGNGHLEKVYVTPSRIVYARPG